jgi:hypothetical protein
MSVDELMAREAIRQTMARYNIAGDRLQAEEFVAVFTEDAILESERMEEDDAFYCEGREAIRQWISRWGDGSGKSASAERQASFVRHHLSTSLIELAGPDTAKARTYWAVYSDIGPDHAGHYLDDFRKVGDSWLIARRRVRLDWKSPDSIFFKRGARQ